MATEMDVSRQRAWLGESTHPIRSPVRISYELLSPCAVSNLALIFSNTATAKIITSCGSPMKYSATLRDLRLISGKNCFRYIQE
eukprot:scaffold13916_cov78-Phaeocystis_antarctica.AAC.1